MDTKLDLTFAQVVTNQMDDYVQAEALFYPVSMKGGPELPPLTIGNWLETEWHLSVAAPNDPVLKAARAEVQRVRGALPDLYQNKARREFKSRMDTWALWLADQGNAPDIQRAYGKNPVYAAQVHVRLKLELLRDNVPQPEMQIMRLLSADDDLRRHVKTSGFVWEPALAAAAPRDKWWWLYGA